MLKVIGFSSLIVLALTASAEADPLQGLYIAGGAGVSVPPAMTSDQHNDKFTTDIGPLGRIALGWAFGNGLRAEFEGNYRFEAITSISTQRNLNGSPIGVAPVNNPTGHESNYGVMANVIYDLPITGIPGSIQPYIGLGAGYSWLNLSSAGGSENLAIKLGSDTVKGPGVIRYGTGAGFAYQAIAGVAIPVASVPGLDFTIEDRFLGAARIDTTARATLSTLVNGSYPFFTRTASYNPTTNVVMLGLRYSFGTK